MALPRTTRARRALPAAGTLTLLALIGGTAACGNSAVPVTVASPSSSGPSTAPSSDPSTEPSTDPSSDASSTSSDGSGGSTGAAGTTQRQVGDRTVLLPSVLTFPDGAVASDVTASFVVLSGPSPAEALTFYRQALPAAGVTVTMDAGGVLSWENKQWSGSVITTSKDTTVTWAAVE